MFHSKVFPRLAWLLSALIVCSTSVYCQTIFDDFESYNVGDLIAASSSHWTTWSDTLGGPDDLAVTNSASWSGDNSLHFSSNLPDGGPEDIVLLLGGPYASGSFEVEWKMYVEDGKGAYVGFQEDGQPPYRRSPLLYFHADGTLRVSESDKSYYYVTYPTGTWFSIRFEVNSKTNAWSMFIDDQSVLQFGCSNFQIGSINFHPYQYGDCGSGPAGFWIDDVSFTHTPETNFPTTNAGIVGLTRTTGFPGQYFDAYCSVRNQGLDTIDSLRIKVTYDNLTIHRPLSTHLAPMETASFWLADSLTIMEATTMLQAEILSVNAQLGDGDASDDIRTWDIRPFEPIQGKTIVIETQTSTDCAQCVGNTMMLDYLEEKHPEHFIGIEIHGDDPMEHYAYLNNVLSTGPNLSYNYTDRAHGIKHPDGTFSQIVTRSLTLPKTSVFSGADINSTQDTMSVALRVVANSPITGPLSANVVLIENGVAGSDSGYVQQNGYSGVPTWFGNTFASLPSAVPANQMVYDRVARYIAPDVEGQSFNLSAIDMAAGDTAYATFQIPIDPDWNLDSTRIIGMMFNSCGRIDNATQATYAEALETGYGSILNAPTPMTENLDVSITPNPAMEYATVHINSSHAQTAQITMISVSGKEVYRRAHNIAPGKEQVQLPVSGLPSGIYLVRLHSDHMESTLRLAVL